MRNSFGHNAQGRLAPMALACGIGLAAAGLAHGQTLPVTPAQRATAQQVAQAGVPLSELAPNAPDSYTVKRGDTLWAVSGVFLRSPWRWPELWGMNLDDIRNPHLIFPGQQLFLLKANGRATLSTRPAGEDPSALPTIKVSPRTRSEALAENALAAIPLQVIEPFLVEPLIVEEGELLKAPRLVGNRDGRVLMSRGDRGYAKGTETLLSDPGPGKRVMRIFRDAAPRRDPDTNAILAYEAQFIGRAELVRPEVRTEVVAADGTRRADTEPATLDIVFSREEIRSGDRLVPEAPREFSNFVPRPPEKPVQARIMSVYGTAVATASQNQVVLINRGKRDGLEQGHVLAIQQDGPTITDRTGAVPTPVKLPNERNGLLIVFRLFDKVSYGLVLDSSDAVRVGDRLTNPR